MRAFLNLLTAIGEGLTFLAFMVTAYVLIYTLGA